MNEMRYKIKEKGWVFLILFLASGTLSTEAQILKNKKQNIQLKKCTSYTDSQLNIEIFTPHQDSLPQFIGGDSAMVAYLKTNLVENPEYENGIKFPGVAIKVYVSFIVEPNGQLSSIKVIRGFSPEFDKIVYSVIKGMPDWKPGICNGKNVPVRLTLPINIREK